MSCPLFAFFLLSRHSAFFLFFFFNDTATTEIYTLSLHDALPISRSRSARRGWPRSSPRRTAPDRAGSKRESPAPRAPRSEEHTSELQSLAYLVCRLLLEKKKKKNKKRQDQTDRVHKKV